MHATGQTQQSTGTDALPDLSFLDWGYEEPQVVTLEPPISAELHDAIMELAELLESSDADEQPTFSR